MQYIILSSMRLCKVSACNNKVYAKDLCKVHYDKNHRHNDPLFERKIKKGTACSIVGCNKPFFANDLCSMHDGRRRRHGDPNFINPKCNRDGKYKDRARAKTAQWKKDNKESYNAYLASRKARVRKATPKWADLAAIREFYKNCPEGYHVDHIIPINGKDVSGLHVIDNLQYLPAMENLKKSNKVILD